MNIKWVGSPNYDTNRKPIDRVVIHWFGVGKQTGADAQFQKTASQGGGTSAHYSVEDDSVHQYVKEENVAYHAGNYAMNQRSIGIEHSAEPNRPATDLTYETAGKLLGEICKRHNIPLDRTHIIKHSEVKATQCPGTMDVDRLIAIAKQNTGEGANMPNMYKGLDLSNAESMKVAVDIWYAVVQEHKYITVDDSNKSAIAAYDKGYDEGKSQGFQDGKNQGDQEGYKRGYDEGYAKGKSEVPAAGTPTNPDPEWDAQTRVEEFVTEDKKKVTLTYKRK